MLLGETKKDSFKAEDIPRTNDKISNEDAIFFVEDVEEPNTS
jgi:hypothetical protein